MRKNIIYIGFALIIGFFAGWLLFSKSETSVTENTVDDSKQFHKKNQQMWTCSMHPQIMQSEPGDCPICGMNLIPVESNASGLAANEIKMTENAMALANIQTTTVENASSNAENKISLSGKIKMNEEENAIQASYFDGRIERLYINHEGQKVQKGQRLAMLYAPKLVAAQQELITAASLKKSQPLLYQAVRNKLKFWKLSDAQINNIEETGTIREKFPIYATVGGTVSEKMTSEGDYVKQGDPIVKVSNLNSVWAEFDVYENQISAFAEGQKIKVVADAYPTKEFVSKISFIDPVLDTQTRTVKVRVDINNEKGFLKPGMFVTGMVLGTSEVSTSQLTIPASAVLWTGERSLVYVKTNPNEPVFQMREVTLGDRNGETYLITSGLQIGDEIVTHGTFTVDAAAQLQGKKSMMNQEKKENVQSMSSAKIELPNDVKKIIRKSLTSYFKMSDAFVNNDAESVAVFANKTLDEFKVTSHLELGEVVRSHFSKIKETLSAIAETNDIDSQRNHFVILNQNMVPIVMNVENANLQLYVQKCPMANNNSGAYWISQNKEIRNPYYGRKMLTCGSIMEEIK